MKKVGFIGFGNMAQAIIKGLISSNNFKSEEIGAFDLNKEILSNGEKELGITAFSSNEELVKNCKCVVLAVKPIALQSVLEPLQATFEKFNPLIISIAAGQSTDKLKSLLGYDAHIVRVMPNINALVCQAVSGYTKTCNVSDEEMNMAIKILESFGTCVEVEEDKFSAFSAIAGCSPAYVYLFLDAVSRVAVKYGLTKKEALSIVSKTAQEAVNLKSSTDDSDLDEVILNAVESAYNKDKGMGK